ncbi:flagellar protein FlaG [Janthinobacterium sp. HLX7-2]|uniref:flagellar protein FlaG n=1 Tax=Janthinobacterium sp. HLX7-2 TaxID=1259331 RepID=UPI003F20FAA4
MDKLHATGSAAAALQRATTATTAYGAAPAITASKSAPAAGKAGSEPELKDVRQAVSDINKAMQFMSRELEFSVDTDSNRTVVKVIDQQTREVIRQMPTEEALEIGKALEKVQGLLIKQTA